MPQIKNHPSIKNYLIIKEAFCTLLESLALDAKDIPKLAENWYSQVLEACSLATTALQEKEKGQVIALLSHLAKERTNVVDDYCGLVKAVAKRFSSSGVPFMDLYQEGTFGLLQALDTFDLSKGTAFSTYAVWKIRWVIQSLVLDLGYCVALTQQRANQLHLIKKLTKGDSSFGETTRIAEGVGLPTHGISWLLNLGQPLDSGDKEDTLQCNDDLSKGMDISKVIKHLPNILATILTARENLVICHYYGIGYSNEEATLEDISRLLGISKERVRQIKEGALSKLGSPSKRKLMLDYLAIYL